MTFGPHPPFRQTAHRGRRAIHFQIADIRAEVSPLKHKGVHFAAASHVVNRTPKAELRLAAFNVPCGNQLASMSEAAVGGA